jgi:hypothetical protein
MSGERYTEEFKCEAVKQVLAHSGQGLLLPARVAHHPNPAHLARHAALAQEKLST